MFAVGKDFRLVRQVRAAAIDQVDARQVVLEGDLLRAKVLFHGDREVDPALHRGVVADNHALAPRDAADARDHAGGRRLAIIHAVGRERGQLQEGRTRVDELLDALARQKLAAGRMPRARTFRPAERRLCRFRAQLVHQTLHCSSIALKALRRSTYLRV